MFQNWYRKIDPPRRKRIGMRLAMSGTIIFIVTFVAVLARRALLPDADAAEMLSLLILPAGLLIAVGSAIKEPPSFNPTYGIALLFADDFPRDRLVTQLQEAGVVLEEVDPEVYGWLHTPQTLVTFRDTTWELEIVTYDPAQYHMEHREAITRKRDDLLRILGREPQTMLTIALEQGKPKSGGELAAMQVICHLARSWPCAVENGDEHIVSAQDVCDALQRQQPILAIHDR